jgi:putative heme-binding domain-containing protein
MLGRSQPWLVLGTVLVLIGAEHSPTLLGAETLRGTKAMSLAPGYSVELVAEPPQTLRPMMGGFDDQGRLYLAESAGENLEAKDLLAKTPNFIRRLVDADGDGRFESSTIFADQLTFPMGALWYRGSIYAASPPYIWKLTDTDDDGVADQREVLVGQFGFIGNAADIHGCFLSPGGRVYWCDGRHGHEFLDEQGKVLSKGKAARIFSCLPDGSDVRWHAGGGMDNPVEVDFLPEGPTLGVVNLFYPKRGDCLVHWLHGGVYPREDMPVQLAEFKRTGDLLGPVHDFGHVAVSGCIRYRGSGRATDGRSEWWVTHFNTHQVIRVRLSPAGSSYSATSDVILSSSDPDFHPTDVIEDADGSVLVVDTGGWFRNGCPTSQLAKPNITGGIYRVRRSGSPVPADPRGQRIRWQEATPEELVTLLEDARPAVVEKAKDTLAQKIARAGKDSDLAAQVLARWDKVSGPARQEIIWAWTRAGIHPPNHAFDDPDPAVRQSAVCALQDRPDRDRQPILVRLLANDPSPAVRRESAVALGMLGPGSVPALLEAAASATDRSFDHALIYALIQLGETKATRMGLADDRSAVRRTALTAVDQFDPDSLTREDVAPLLDTTDPALLRTALDVIAKRSGWSEEIIGLARDWIASTQLEAERESMLRGVLLAFQQEEAVQSLVADSLALGTTSATARRLLLEVIARSDLAELPQAWRTGVRQALGDAEASVRSAGVEAAARSVPEFADQLIRLACADSESPSLRLASARLLTRRPQPLPPEVWQVLWNSLTQGDGLERLATADAVGAASLSPQQQADLVPLLREAGPIELASLLRAFEKPGDRPWADALAKALSQATARRSISLARLTRLVEEIPSLADDLEPLAQQIRDQQQGKADRIKGIVQRVSVASAERGRQLFASARTSCLGCHAVGGQGGAIGPDLSKIGTSRTARDLAESILLPSASLARGYESVRVISQAGTVTTGVIARESLDSLWIRTADRTEVRILRSEIDELAPSTQSIMPEGLEQSLSEEESADLVAYLLSLR